MVILAAGTSTRMGQPKLLLEWQGKSLIRHAADTALASLAGSVIVVSGPRDQEMRALLANLPVTIVHNPDYAEGMSTSLRAGINALPASSLGAIIMLGDQPLVSSDVIRALAEALQRSGALIVQPRYAGVPGNPVGFHCSLFPDLRQQTGDQGARDLVRARRSEISYVDFESSAPQQDIDTPEDYAAITSSQPRQTT